MPATAGPTTREALNIAELRAMALIRSSLPTISMMNAWRAGMSKALTTPRRAESTNTCQMRTVLVRVRNASAKASSIDAVWVAMTTWRRLRRSAAMPPSTENANTGIWPEKPTRPSSAEEPVRLYTSQDCATFCIQVPTRLMSWPPKKSWKFLYLSARSVTGKFMRERSFQYTGRLGDCQSCRGKLFHRPFGSGTPGTVPGNVGTASTAD